MTTDGVLLYVCAAAVITCGLQVAVASAADDDPGPGSGSGEAPPPVALLRTWRPPLPFAALALSVLMAGLAVAQNVFPGMVDALERHPGGSWWRAVTALGVQSSGWSQIVFNLAALVVVAPVAERRFGPWRMLLVFLVSGVAAQAVSMAGWSRTGGGDSVAVCGLVGALAGWYALRGVRPGARRLAVVVPVAGVVLCLLANNHGVGLVVGAALGTVAGCDVRRGWSRSSPRP
ncbi:rhomboid family intramembrane serine protease [Streptomyces sp. NPDC001904]|uniref:rhomboid family intramembrane serine protease n=1 Tax=Streptomyces sp. NPDC001904 TaxID=3154531 RepID=UPI003327F533